MGIQLQKEPCKLAAAAQAGQKLKTPVRRMIHHPSFFMQKLFIDIMFRRGGIGTIKLPEHGIKKAAPGWGSRDKSGLRYFIFFLVHT
jgi:hypothetical protein